MSDIQTTMRYAILLLLLVTLLGCQSPNADRIRVVQPESTTAQTSTVEQPVVVLLPTATSMGPASILPEPTKSRGDVSKPATGETPEPDVSLPVEPTELPSPTPPLDGQQDEDSESIWSYLVVNEYPHDIQAYTQGLVIEEDSQTLLEGTGRDSFLRRVDLSSGEVLRQHSLHDAYFGEGITLYEDKVYQLTWRSNVGFIYDSQTFEQLGEFYYPHEGWGLTHDDSQLIISDGTEIIRFLDPTTFSETRRIEVVSEDGPLMQINELEYVNGEIWANVWYTDLIARISPQDGRVLGWIDLAGLLPDHLRVGPEAVLNGIAYDSENDRLFVTGKLWPTLFEIEVVEFTEAIAQ